MTIDKQIEESIHKLDEKFGESQQVKRFENSVKEFDLLVENGIASKRGNHLLSISDAHLRKRISFNCSL